MSLIPISIQLYTLRDEAAQDFPAVLRLISDIGYTGVEFAGLHGHSAAELAGLLADLNLQGSSAHVGLPTRETITEIADTYKTLGISLLVAGFGPGDFDSPDAVRATADRFEAAAEIAKEYGFGLGAHNHDWEFKRLEDGGLPYDLLLAHAPNIFSELDVYWAQVGGSDPASVVAKHQDRLTLLHIKDGPAVRGKKMTAVGSGVLNIPEIIGSADSNVTKWLIVELDECDTDMVQAVKDSYTYLVDNGLASGGR